MRKEIDARRASRVDGRGRLVLLEDQDRSRWDANKIEEGRLLVIAALSGGPPGPYGLQAAIAAVHNDAAAFATTDWPQIVALYDRLLAVTPSPIIEVNRAIAVSMVDGPEAGLALLDALDAEPQLSGYPSVSGCPGGSVAAPEPSGRGGASVSPSPRPGRQ